VGLGIGSLASYSLPGQRWTFCELDPASARLARNSQYFTYLSKCGDRCRVVLGDARWSVPAIPELTPLWTDDRSSIAGITDFR
jgi:hypothetical protein